MFDDASDSRREGREEEEEEDPELPNPDHVARAGGTSWFHDLLPPFLCPTSHPPEQTWAVAEKSRPDEKC